MDATTTPSNPWAPPSAEDARRAALGGIHAFVQRNALDTPDALQAANDTIGSASYSSMQLTRGLSDLLAQKTSVLSLTRELEQLERAAATAGCMLPHQLQLRIQHATTLRDQLHELVSLKPVLLHTLRSHSASVSSIDIETEHQRTFIALFEKLGAELPRHAHVLNTLDGIDVVAADLVARQRAFDAINADVAATIAAFDALHRDIVRLRAVYKQLLPPCANSNDPN